MSQIQNTEYSCNVTNIIVIILANIVGFFLVTGEQDTDYTAVGAAICKISSNSKVFGQCICEKNNQRNMMTYIEHVVHVPPEPSLSNRQQSFIRDYFSQNQLQINMLHTTVMSLHRKHHNTIYNSYLIIYILQLHSRQRDMQLAPLSFSYLQPLIEIIKYRES